MPQYHRIAAVAHGFRSSFRDWAAEETDHPGEVIKAALAHVVHSKVALAYARSDLCERRRRLKVCRKRLFAIHADRLRPRLTGGRLPVAGPRSGGPDSTT